MNELWRNIDGYKEMYQVSSLGNVRSYKYGYPKILSSRIHKNGYRYINLSLNGNIKSVNIHRLVAKSFIKNNDKLEFVNHKDGNKLNNYVENLEWCSRKYNSEHAKNNNLLAFGERNGSSKLKENDVINIRIKYYNGKSSRILAKEFGVSKSCILNIINNISWTK